MGGGRLTSGRDETLRALAERIVGVGGDHPVRVAIDGVDAAGKTTLADELAGPIESLGRTAIRSSIDSFHNPRTVRYRRGESSVEGYLHDSFDYAALTRELLNPMGPGGSRTYRVACFDHEADATVDAPSLRAPTDAVLLFDGIFLLRPELRGHWDFSIFLRVDFSETLRRALERDQRLLGGVEAVRDRYERRYIPAQKLYLERMTPERFASVVIDNNEPDRARILDS